MGVIVDITTRCNMACGHCMWSRDVHTGEDMTLETFKQALSMEPVRGYGTLSLGTGEPTVHPQFWDFVDAALADERWTVRVVTNGKRTKIALKIAEMARSGVLEGHLSLDKWHDPIDPDVVEAFKRDPSLPNDRRAYRHCKDEDLKNAGRCDFGPRRGPTCRCPVPKIIPDGTVFWCGCETALAIGHVSSGWDVNLVSRPRQLGCQSFLPGADRSATRDFFGKMRLAVLTGKSRDVSS